MRLTILVAALCVAPSMAGAQQVCDHRWGPHDHSHVESEADQISAEDILDRHLVRREYTPVELNTTMMPMRQVGAAWQPMIREHTFDGAYLVNNLNLGSVVFVEDEVAIPRKK